MTQRGVPAGPVLWLGVPSQAEKKPVLAPPTYLCLEVPVTLGDVPQTRCEAGASSITISSGATRLQQ